MGGCVGSVGWPGVVEDGVVGVGVFVVPGPVEGAVFSAIYLLMNYTGRVKRFRAFAAAKNNPVPNRIILPGSGIGAS